MIDARLAALRSDLEPMADPAGRSTLAWLPDVAARVALVPRVRTVVQLRLAQAVAPRFMPAAHAIQARTLRSAGAEISPLARIGPGLCIMHSTGIVIGPDVSIGRGLRIYQNVTLGDGSTPGQPDIGDDVTIGAGAGVLGGGSGGGDDAEVWTPSADDACGDGPGVLFLDSETFRAAHGPGIREEPGPGPELWTGYRRVGDTVVSVTAAHRWVALLVLRSADRAAERDEPPAAPSYR